jgi:large subunit ribosomal protein L21e
MSTYLINFKVGDIVDIKSDSRIQKSLPHKFYHGKTGKVFDVTPHAVGVVINKPVRGRIERKKIRVRIEHVTKSRCREQFLDRVKKNAANTDKS